MNIELKNAVLSIDVKAQYDECVKKLLGHKIILAHILTKAIEEFRRLLSILKHKRQILQIIIF